MSTVVEERCRWEVVKIEGLKITLKRSTEALSGSETAVTAIESPKKHTKKTITVNE